MFSCAFSGRRGLYLRGGPSHPAHVPVACQHAWAYELCSLQGHKMKIEHASTMTLNRCDSSCKTQACQRAHRWLYPGLHAANTVGRVSSVLHNVQTRPPRVWKSRWAPLPAALPAVQQRMARLPIGCTASRLHTLGTHTIMPALTADMVCCTIASWMLALH